MNRTNARVQRLARRLRNAGFKVASISPWETCVDGCIDVRIGRKLVSVQVPCCDGVSVTQQVGGNFYFGASRNELNPEGFAALCADLRSKPTADGISRGM